MPRADARALVGLTFIVLCAAAWRSVSLPADGAKGMGGLSAVVEIDLREGEMTIMTPPGTRVHYTLDGSIPTIRSDEWEGPIALVPDDRALARLVTTPTSVQWRHPVGGFPTGVVVRACACDEMGHCGPVSTRTFFPQGTGTELPVLSIVLPKGGFFDPDSGIMVVGHGIFRDDEAAVKYYGRDERWWKYPGNFQFRGREWERTAHMEWFDRGAVFVSAADVRVRINGQNTRGFPQHALRLTFNGPALGPDGRPHHSLVLRTAGNDQARAFMRDAVQHQLCVDLPFETSSARPIVVFINGAYWGIHEVRERIDADEMALRHEMRKKDFTMLEDRAVLDHGDSVQVRVFNTFLHHLGRADPTDPDFAASVTKEIDPDDFFTYVAAQVVLGNTDWPGQNVKFWRYTGVITDTVGAKDGRWHFIMGDSDMGLGYTAGVEVDIFQRLTSERGPIARLFLAAMRSPVLRDHFRATVFKLLEGPLSTGNMTREILAWRDRLATDMPTHIRRWRRPLSPTIWQAHVDEVLTFAAGRDAIVRVQLDRHLPALH